MIMKALLLLSFSTSSTVAAVECGKWYTSSCLAESDIRYDENASNDIKDQDDIWGRQEVS